MFRRILIAIIALSWIAAVPASATPHEARISLHDGKLRAADLSAALLHELHLPASHLPGGEINLSTVGGCLLVRAMNKSLGDGCRLEVTASALILHIDPAKLPSDLDSAKLAVRTFTAAAAPEATAVQAAHYGLHLPARIDPARPLVILVHGLDMGQSEWAPMADLLDRAGEQVAYFCYPDDGPIADDSALLGKELAAFHEAHCDLKLDIITYSMGSLVARGYVESPQYTGGVDRLILLAPPNHGSTWARYRILLEWKEHAALCLTDPQWSPTWMITDGLGEAGRDLTPNSTFLDHLNSAPRQSGVRYTIVAGNQHPLRQVLANCMTSAADLVPQKAADWGPLRQCQSRLTTWATDIRSGIDSSDGPVTLDSAALPGVTDVVHVHVAHQNIYQPIGDQPPAAWNVINDRLHS